LGASLHDGDRSIAATAVRLGVPLVSHDGIFADVPGLELIAVKDP
jgi:predicted nucleic acid-binding protein